MAVFSLTDSVVTNQDIVRHSLELGQVEHRHRHRHRNSHCKFYSDFLLFFPWSIRSELYNFHLINVILYKNLQQTCGRLNSADWCILCEVNYL